MGHVNCGSHCVTGAKFLDELRKGDFAVANGTGSMVKMPSSIQYCIENNIVWHYDYDYDYDYENDF